MKTRMMLVVIAIALVGSYFYFDLGEYPTLAEMNKYVAGEWRKNHKPEWLLDLVAKYHCFRRGEKDCLNGRQATTHAPSWR